MSMFGFTNKRLAAIRGEEVNFAKTLEGWIAGVHFDLRQDGLIPEAWDFPPLISAKTPGHVGFHVYHDFSPAAAEAMQGGFALAASLAVLGTPEEAVERAQRDGLDVLYPGDHVRALAVKMLPLSEDQNQLALALAPDRYAALIEMQVERSDGSREGLSSLLVLPRGSMALPFDSQMTLSLLRERMATLIEERPQEAFELVELAMQVEGALSRMKEQLWKRDEKLEQLGGLVGLGLLAGPVFELDHLINQAALYGYRQGRLEAATHMEPLAWQSLKRSEVNRGNASLPRLPKRVDFAKIYWLANPTATKYAVAKAYCTEHPDEDQTSVERSVAKYAPETSPSYRSRA